MTPWKISNKKYSVNPAPSQNLPSEKEAAPSLTSPLTATWMTVKDDKPFLPKTVIRIVDICSQNLD
jgi:hypothetical protein